MNEMLNQPLRAQPTADERWAGFKPIVSGDDYVNSLRGRNLDVYLFGERIDEPTDHPMVRPSINALKETYDLAQREPQLAGAKSHLTGNSINRFLHIPHSPQDLVLKNRMQRKLGQLTGTCFQRCAGLDAISVMHSITYDMDQAHGTQYHPRFLAFLETPELLVLADGQPELGHHDIVARQLRLEIVDLAVGAHPVGFRAIALDPLHQHATIP